MDEEDLKNMSPEQIAQLQRQNCVFCKIVAGEIPPKKIYEDSHFIGILDINPATDGHVLIVPKQHVQIMPQMSSEQIAGLGAACQHVSGKVIKAFGCGGTSVFMANGVVAGQRAPHFLIHVIPRNDGDGISLNPGLSELGDGEFSSLKEKILSAIGARQRAPNGEKASPPKKEALRKRKSREVEAEYKDVEEQAKEWGEEEGDAEQEDEEETLRKGAEREVESVAARRKEEEERGGVENEPEEEDEREERELMERKNGKKNGNNNGDSKIDFDKLARLFR
jgi:histidine triad (HIT) family protein